MREGRKPEYIGLYNKNLVLEILIKIGPKSRAELARISKLTKTAISEIVDELIEKNILIEVGKVETSRGRRPTKLTINPELKVLAIDLSGLEGRVGVVNANGKIEEDRYHPIEKKEDLFQLIDPLLIKYKNNVVAISLSVPGIIDKYNGEVILSVGLNWKNFKLKEFLKEKYPNYPIYMEKDTNSGLLSELWFGEGKNFNILFYLLFEKGIGLGIYYKGNIIEGFNNIEGEIGHTIVSKEIGEKCWCGNKGCLESIASIPKIQEKILDLGSLEKALINYIQDNKNSVLQEIFEFLGISLANTIHILAPEAICISGNRGMTKDILNLFTKILKDKVDKYVFEYLKDKIYFYTSPLGNDGLLIGAGILGFINYFRELLK
ncbi:MULTISPECIES: ROK family transcriptional regulator [Dictyoglomus]|jgi:glucokinase|uniref:ROK family protein n=1 Tax=Dictyoglomus turgidum (strain DSM 6724 / Z-1310) TaxID=515635 RepID=B8E378_DICTD|nr:MULTISPECIES: ROK family transcriptional regulator [Dictyoglomus]ACK42952.1 ROK family protein [Dictyoglomus turgidum DSM 6724]PNV80420.1 MAG: ROK family transcriptional regulator [Dictyoglomus turgidum]HBU31016.1 ROK family transcriptional regulator [Dictyoglomus sp.]